jgi:restriction endonuclease S subunit
MKTLDAGLDNKSIFGVSPSGWQIDRIRDRVGKIVGGDWGDDVDAHDDGVEIPVVRVADIRGLDLATNNLTIRRVQHSKLLGRLIGERTVLLEKSGGGEQKPVGRAVRGRLIDFEAICSNFMAKTDCDRKADPSFIVYVLNAAYSRGVNTAHIQQTTGIQNLRVTHYLNSKIAFPSLPEQERIAAYLDASSAAIDAAATAKRSQLENLDALRRTVIQESVTKGLDPSVEMRESDIDWLPEIPKDWNKAKLKRHVEIFRGQFTIRPRNDPAYYDGPYPFIQTGSISAVDKFITEFTQTLNEDGLRISKLFPADTVVMTITGAKIAEVAVTTFEACFPDSIVGFVPDHCLNRDYLYYLLIAMKPALLRAMVVTTQPNINYVQIGGNYIPLPPVKEQEAIAKHIEQRIGTITDIQKSLNEQITALTAYRKSLIHECVTGQRRVTEADVAAATNAKTS